MTLSDKYRRIMDQIEVDDEMRRRILSKVDQQSVDMRRNFKRRWKNIIRAACLVVVIIGAFTMNNKNKEQKIEYVQSPTRGSITFDSAQQLAAYSSLPVVELKKLPFQVDRAVYEAYQDGLAQITYTGRENSCFYRVSKETGDISGDYTEYMYTEQVKRNGFTVTCKAEKDGYHLAVWQIGDYSYSIWMERGASLEQMIELVDEAAE